MRPTSPSSAGEPQVPGGKSSLRKSHCLTCFSMADTGCVTSRGDQGRFWGRGSCELVLERRSVGALWAGQEAVERQWGMERREGSP